MILGNNIYLLSEALDGLGKIGVMVFDDRGERSAKPFKKSEQFTLLRSGRGEHAAFSGAEKLHKLGCETLLTWGTVHGLDHDYPGGSLILPTRVVDTGAHESFDTALAAHSRCERVVLISTKDPQDLSTKRRNAMRYQAVAADVEAATVARYACWNRLSYAGVHAISDTRIEEWANRKPSWLHEAVKKQLPVSWRPWFLSPENMLRRWQEHHRAADQLRRAAKVLVEWQRVGANQVHDTHETAQLGDQR